MRLFAQAPGEAVSRERLVGDLGREDVAQERAVDVQITRLRRKIEEDPKARAICRRCGARGICWHRIDWWLAAGGFTPPDPRGVFRTKRQDGMIVYSHSDGLGHVTPPGHPERVERLAAVEAGLAGLAVERRECPMGDEADVLRCHPAGYLAAVKAAVPDEGWAQLDGDTFLSPGSFEAAMRAVGGVCAAVDAVVADGGAAFVGCRPPGHHAETAKAMGFCLFGTVAIGVEAGAGFPRACRAWRWWISTCITATAAQDLLWDEGRCLFASSHQMPLFPGTGRPEERGRAWADHERALARRVRTGGRCGRSTSGWCCRRWPTGSPICCWSRAGFDAHADRSSGGVGVGGRGFCLAGDAVVGSRRAGGWSRLWKAAMIWMRWRHRSRRMWAKWQG